MEELDVSSELIFGIHRVDSGGPESFHDAFDAFAFRRELFEFVRVFERDAANDGCRRFVCASKVAPGANGYAGNVDLFGLGDCCFCSTFNEFLSFGGHGALFVKVVKFMMFILHF